jgi:hypothetical protein
MKVSVEPTVPAELESVLVVRDGGVHHSLQAGRTYRIGCDPQSDIVMTDPQVSWQHAIVRVENDRWWLEDAGSTNGIFIGSRRVERLEISDDCEVRLSDPDSGHVLAFVITAAPQDPIAAHRSGSTLRADHMAGVDRTPSAVMSLPVLTLRIGRAPDNDLRALPSAPVAIPAVAGRTPR